MSRFNTGNPLGSGSPLDLDDNAKNMDLAVNSDGDTFQDRLGKSRLTWTGIVKAGSGDPAIAVDAAARAVAAAGQVEQDAERIVQDATREAAGYAASANAAAISATYNADVYPGGIGQALADPALPVGAQFQVVEDGNLTRYRKDGATSYTLMFRFVDIVSAPNNLISQATVTRGKVINSTTGELDDSDTRDTSQFVRVSYLEKLVAKDVFRTGYYDEDFNFVSVSVASDLTVPAGTAYARFSFSSTDIDTAQVNRGTSLKPYDDGMYYFNPAYPLDFPPPSDGTVGTSQLVDKSVTAGKTDFILDSPNLVDPDEVVLNKTFNSSTGELADSLTADATGFIPVVPATNYVGRVNRVAWYRADKSFILSYGRDGSAPSVFTAPAEAAFVRVAIPVALRDEWRINEGDTFLPYEPFGMRLDPRIRVTGLEPGPAPDPGPDPVELPYAFTAEPIPDYYVPDPSLPYGELTTNRTTTFVQDLYDRYEALANEFTDYVNGVNLGPDQSGDYSVYRYTLSPFVVPNNLTKPLPRIAIVCGTHGAEKNSQFALYHFIYDLCHNWRDNEALRYLRWGVIIDLIPCANPWAFENGAGRKNSRGVDLNRNMDAGWTYNPDPESTTYAGTEPFSEVESQYIRDFIDDNLSALAVGDYHNHFSQPPAYFIWHALQTGYEGNEVLEVFSSTVIRKCTLNIADRYGLDVPLTSGQISYATPNGKVRDYAMKQGIPAMTLECFPKLDQSDYPTSIQAATEYTGNWFLSLVSAFWSARALS